MGTSSRGGAHWTVGLQIMVVAWALQACGDGPTGPPDTFVLVVPSEATLLLEGRITLRAIVLDEAADSMLGRAVNWTTRHESVATVDGSGHVTAQGIGSTVIQATSEGRSGSALVRVTGLEFVEIDAGAHHTCGVTNDERAYCWGEPSSGQLGIGRVPPETDQPVPTLVSGDHPFTTLSAGGGHTCGIRADGRGMCWGTNYFGELGDGDVSGRTKFEPTELALHAPLSSLSAAWHTCGIAATGVHCWGPDFLGELGDGDRVYYGHATVPVLQPGTFSQVSTGAAEFTCGVLEDGTGYCWGDNSQGQLGDGTATPKSIPTQVSGGAHFRSISAGGAHVCGVTDDSRLLCWGYNASGQLGDATETSRSVPTPVAADLAFQSVSVGTAHTCALTPTGEAYCWGANGGGQLGDGGTTGSSTPRRVETAVSFGTLSSGTLHTCGLSVDGVAYCWGSNEHGQLGDGRHTSRWTPHRVMGQL